MNLYQTPPQPESDADHLASEARKVITTAADSTFWAYTQLQNYLFNNGRGVTPDEVKKAIGSPKEFDSALGYMKRFLEHVNPDFKTKIADIHKQHELQRKQLAKLTPKKPKKKRK